jgi:hypothetical protein
MKITIAVTPEQAEIVLAAIQRGEFAEFGDISAEWDEAGDVTLKVINKHEPRDARSTPAAKQPDDAVDNVEHRQRKRQGSEISPPE